MSTVRRSRFRGKQKDDLTPTERTNFARSFSPKSPQSNGKLVQRPASPLQPPSFRRSRNTTTPIIVSSLFPALLGFEIKLRLISRTFIASIDTRKFGECLLLLGSLFYSVFTLSSCTTSSSPRIPAHTYNHWIRKEINILCIIAILYLCISHCRINKFATSPPQTESSASPSPSPSVQGAKGKRIAQMSHRANFSYVWMTVPKNYRDSRDDGLFTGILLGPLVALSTLHSAVSVSPEPKSSVPSGWLIEAPINLPLSNHAYTSAEALVLSRYSLVDLATLCSAILMFHVGASWWLETRRRTAKTVSEGERASVPRSELRRSLYYISFTFCVSLGTVVIGLVCNAYDLGIWQHLNVFEITVASLFFQFTLYVSIRLAHRGFTLGELGLMAFGGTALSLELLNFTIAIIWPITTPFIKSYRIPTPLLIYQMALISGSFIVGFALSPFLVLSRHVAAQPLKRMRNPHEKQRNKRFLAFGFYIGSLLIVGGPIGFWARWCLGKRDPWLWVIYWIFEGRSPWSRPALLLYWGLLGVISVAGWNRQLARSTKYRSGNRNATLDYSRMPSASETLTSLGAFSLSFDATTSESISPIYNSTAAYLPSLPNLPSSSDMSNRANELLDAADKRVPTLSLNARRKFFHVLAVVMFIPGIAFDPAFTHLSFSVGFALFIFAEYVRYFALYPFGAAVHVFMNEFLDHKDSGTAILSHFFLLTGCAGSLWLEGRAPLLNFAGTLALGVGDAMASIIGRRNGRRRWSPSTAKTLEGSLAFVLSVTWVAWILRLCGMTGPFSIVKFVLVVGISSVLEALSDQNDNLTLPLYMWSLLVLVV